MHFKESLRRAVFAVLSSLNTIVPKKKRVFLYAPEGLYGNREAIFEYLLEHTEFPIVCLSDSHRDFNLRKNVRIMPTSLLREIYYLLTSRVVIDTHLHKFRAVPARQQFSLQLWHGTPLKWLPSDPSTPEGIYYSKILCPAPFFRGIYERVFCVGEDRLLLGGNPRNDYLFSPATGSLIPDGIRRCVIWMPTFRHGLGAEESRKDLPILHADNLAALDSFLAAHAMLLFIKPHPLQNGALREAISGNAHNVQLLTDEMLLNEQIPLYRFVGAMDALLTDYSSVYFDYLLLDRPIGFAIDDMAEYAQNRGFCFDDPLSYMPGEKIYDMDGLLSFLRNLIEGKDAWQEERARICRLSNHFRDANNCARAAACVEAAMEESHLQQNLS